MYFRYTRVSGPCVVLQNKIKIEKKRAFSATERGFKGHLVDSVKSTFCTWKDDPRTSQTHTNAAKSTVFGTRVAAGCGWTRSSNSLFTRLNSFMSRFFWVFFFAVADLFIPIYCMFTCLIKGR